MFLMLTPAMAAAPAPAALRSNTSAQRSCCAQRSALSAQRSALSAQRLRAYGLPATALHGGMRAKQLLRWRADEWESELRQAGCLVCTPEGAGGVARYRGACASLIALGVRLAVVLAQTNPLLSSPAPYPWLA
jgi:hypothetical protein